MVVEAVGHGSSFKHNKESCEGLGETLNSVLEAHRDPSLGSLSERRRLLSEAKDLLKPQQTP